MNGKWTEKDGVLEWFDNDHQFSCVLKSEASNEHEIECTGFPFWEMTDTFYGTLDEAKQFAVDFIFGVANARASAVRLVVDHAKEEKIRLTVSMLEKFNCSCVIFREETVHSLNTDVAAGDKIRFDGDKYIAVRQGPYAFYAKTSCAVCEGTGVMKS